MFNYVVESKMKEVKHEYELNNYKYLNQGLGGVWGTVTPNKEENNLVY